MARPLGTDDQDWSFLDRLIALSLDIGERVERIKDESDEPDVLLPTLEIEARALLIQKISRDYRPRLDHLKKIARLAGRATQEQEGKTSNEQTLP
jgi:hypothetical protein